MATEYLRSGRWPVWHFVRATLNRSDLDADQLLGSLPQVGDFLFSKGYRLAWWDGGPSDESRPGLTIGAVHHVPELLPVMGQPFLLVLRKLVEIQRNLPLSPDEITTATYTPDDIRKALPSISDQFMAKLPDILSHEPPTWGAFLKGGHDWSWWQRRLSREIARYKDVDLRDIRSYVQRVSELMEPERSFGNGGIHIGSSGAASIFEAPAATLPLEPSAAVAQVYVKESLIKELEDKQSTAQWDLTKLIRLVRELNSNFAAENPYACHGLLRAILDHVAPVFGQKTFEQVASQPLQAWTRTDKDYLRKLLDFKPQGHDALHRHIRKTPDLIDMHDVPSSAWLNAFLRLVIDAL
ncbi:hypothetical protein ABZT17_25095 [Streptomyces sp. NPDC005648]|uniref:hypothetical protein n=1 Tax=Streptomyces sp. NPDC005648 TaxID=3157044 RepID=UPI00339DE055